MQEQYRQIIGTVARHYWGEPNRKLSTGKELRFGSHGSKSVDLESGTWFDHEAGAGGGVADLVAREEPGAPVVERLAAFGLPKRDERRETAWDYVDQDGELRYQVIRIDHNGEKAYRQRRIEDGRAVWGMLGVTALPYRLPEILASTAPIFICEGEKAADAVAALGLIATTNHGGAGKWQPTLNEHFLGRQVIILPDNDAPGRKHARIVADTLTGTARSIRILELPGLPAKGDVVEWLARGGDREQLTALAKSAPVYDPASAPAIEPDPQPEGELFLPPQITQPPARHVQLVAWDDVVDTPVRWLVDGLLPAGGFAALYGKPGSYKSFVALYMAAMIGTGRDAFGRATEAGDVVYLMGEGGAGLKARRDALMRHHEIPPGVHVHFIRAQLNLRSTDVDATALIHAVQAAGLQPKLLVIDTLARAFGAGNENASEDMGAFILQCGRIQEELGTAVLIVHHSGKDEARGQRGHSSLLGACDAELEVIKLSADESPDRVGQLTVTKQKDGEDGFKIAYRMVDVALTVTGERRSLAVEPIDGDELEGMRSGRKKPLSNQQRLVLMALEKAVNEAGQPASSPHIPSDAAVVSVSLWRQTFYTMSDGEAEAKQKAFRRAIEALTASRTCGVWADYAWITDACEKNGHAGHGRT
jgi:hypothetical protein